MNKGMVFVEHSLKRIESTDQMNMMLKLKENTAHCLEWIKKCPEDKNCRGIFCAHNPRTEDIL